MKKVFLTARSRFNALDRSLSRLIDKNGDKIVALRDQFKGKASIMNTRIDDLEKKVKIMECGATGHEYTKWERHEHGWGMSFLPGRHPTYVKGTCECGHEFVRYPKFMKPAEKKRFLDMGLVNKDDFPVKTKKKK